MRAISSEERALRNDTAHASQYKSFDKETETFGAPVPPQGLNERALSIFNEFVEMVEKIYELTESDAEGIVLYAKNKDMLLYLEEFLMLNKCTYLKENGQITTRPEVGFLKTCKDLQFKLLDSFGLLPGSENKVRRKKKQKGKINPFAALTNQ
jgi:phage terminase small subunit